jgi:ethanolamine utilization protein EutP (predicted NTPase)
MYPNPFSDELHMESKHSELIVSVTVTDISGKELAVYDSVEASELTLNTAGWEHGIYVISVRTESGVYVQKLMKN